MLTRQECERLIYYLPLLYPVVRISTLVLVPPSMDVAELKGLLNSEALASTHPHHKHIPPDIKHNRIPAPSLGFTQPNLPFLIQEIEQTLLQA